MTTSVTSPAYQQCISPACSANFAVDEIHASCAECGGLLDVNYNWDRIAVPSSLRDFEARWAGRRNPLDLSGVWRFRELLSFAPPEQVVTIGEGQTILRSSQPLREYVGLQPDCLFLQYEGLNPSGSFKDNGMTAASTHAHMTGARIAACASTGNTSASLALFASATDVFRCVVFVGSGRIAHGKLSQALDFGARTLQIQGDFDDALRRVREACAERAIYLCNSLNPFRLEGQKTIMYRVLEGLNWEVPDWIVVPGGNLGNCSAFGKAFLELRQLGLIDRIPRLAVINAEGANSLYQLHTQHGLRWNGGRPDMGAIERFFEHMHANDLRARTVATAIEINQPVNLLKALRSLDVCDGVVRQVSDQEILDAKARVGAGGFGCEPASGASVAGVRRLRREGVIAPSDRVVCILTGHQLKDPDVTIAYHSGDRELFDRVLSSRGIGTASHANPPLQVANDLQSILALLGND